MPHSNVIHLNILKKALTKIASFIMSGIYKFRLHNENIQKPLIKAIHGNELTPYLQPIFDASQKKFIGVEVLMRWGRSGRNIMPERFIPYLEELDLMSVATCHLILKAMSFLNKIEKHLPQNFHISFNISARGFDSHVYYTLCKIIQEYNKRFNFILELTETNLFSPTNINRLMIEHLHSLGAKIAIDDFGTGYSGLSYFNTFNIDIIKIDKTFVCGLVENEKSKKIIENIIDLADRMKVTIIAEGVENTHQKMLLERYRVYMQQGFLYSKPLSIKQFTMFFLGESVG